jgi:uncharacterized protein
LLHATNRQSRSHRESRTWWQSTLLGSQPVGLCAPVVFGYIRLATNPKILDQPVSVQEAFTHVKTWLEYSSAQWLEPDHSHLERVKTLLLEAGTGGNLVTDAQIAAYAQQYNGTVCSADVDFRRFRVKWLNPLSAK